ncbi:hypothetical protein LUZ60_013504 [Juncus effusus]|nr:hypothetical protein LUZ60_013504 [Juncus effusus]
MYADQITTGRKRSVRDRLDGDQPRDSVRDRLGGAKRQRQTDERWKHDLYQNDGKAQISKSVGPRDLRLKLQRKDQKQRTITDLREKLSGFIQPQPVKTRPAPVKTQPVIRPAKPVSEIVKPGSEAKRVVKASSSSKDVSKQKLEGPSIDGFLRSLGLEKYSLTFQAEEIDMAALVHMTDTDLKALGVPMGPRKKILLALESKE